MIELLRLDVFIMLSESVSYICGLKQYEY